VPSAPAKIKASAEAKELAVWTPWHLVTLDSRIDARPERPLPQAPYVHPTG
jgi:hypothetical protein